MFCFVRLNWKKLLHSFYSFHSSDIPLAHNFCVDCLQNWMSISMLGSSFQSEPKSRPNSRKILFAENSTCNPAFFSFKVSLHDQKDHCMHCCSRNLYYTWQDRLLCCSCTIYLYQIANKYIVHSFMGSTTIYFQKHSTVNQSTATHKVWTIHLLSGFYGSCWSKTICLMHATVYIFSQCLLAITPDDGSWKTDNYTLSKISLRRKTDFRSNEALSSKFKYIAIDGFNFTKASLQNLL